MVDNAVNQMAGISASLKGDTGSLKTVAEKFAAELERLADGGKTSEFFFFCPGDFPAGHTTHIFVVYTTISTAHPVPVERAESNPPPH